MRSYSFAFVALAFFSPALLAEDGPQGAKPIQVIGNELEQLDCVQSVWTEEVGTDNQAIGFEGTHTLQIGVQNGHPILDCLASIVKHSAHLSVIGVNKQFGLIVIADGITHENARKTVAAAATLSCVVAIDPYVTKRHLGLQWIVSVHEDVAAWECAKEIRDNMSHIRILKVDTNDNILVLTYRR